MLQTELLSNLIERRESLNTVLTAEPGVFPKSVLVFIDRLQNANTVNEKNVLRVFKHF